MHWLSFGVPVICVKSVWKHREASPLVSNYPSAYRVSPPRLRRFRWLPASEAVKRTNCLAKAQRRKEDPACFLCVFAPWRDTIFAPLNVSHVLSEGTGCGRRRPRADAWGYLPAFFDRHITVQRRILYPLDFAARVPPDNLYPIDPSC